MKAIGPAPHRQHELHDELFGRVAAIAPRLRQLARAQGGVETDVTQHALHQAHPTLGRDLFVGKLQIVTHVTSVSKLCTGP